MALDAGLVESWHLTESRRAPYLEMLHAVVLRLQVQNLTSDSAPELLEGVRPCEIHINDRWTRLIFDVQAPERETMARPVKIHRIVVALLSEVGALVSITFHGPSHPFNLGADTAGRHAENGAVHSARRCCSSMQRARRGDLLVYLQRESESGPLVDVVMDFATRELWQNLMGPARADEHDEDPRK